MPALDCGLDSCAGHDYSESVVRNILIAGIGDTDVKKCVLYSPSVKHAEVKDLVSLVEDFTRRARENRARRMSRQEADLMLYLNHLSGPLDGPFSHQCERHQRERRLRNQRNPKTTATATIRERIRREAKVPRRPESQRQGRQGKPYDTTRRQTPESRSTSPSRPREVPSSSRCVTPSQIRVPR